MNSGNSVKIRKDPWLPDADNPYIITVNEAVQGKTVNSLLVTSESRWDVDLLEDIFEERDVNLILFIPIQAN